jgi:citrate/tricarballylate utilization protein
VGQAGAVRKDELQKHADAAQEGERIMTICNACRYCEGFCAVFPAMERRLNFTGADLNYLANLCHNCAECYYACQYAPPHEFAVNVPQTLAQIRLESYREYSFPAPLARTFRKNGLIVSLVLALSLAASILLAATLAQDHRLLSASSNGDFYRVIPHRIMAGVFGAVSLAVVVVLGAGLYRFLRESEHKLTQFLRFFALKNALLDVFTLANLRSGGTGCTYPRAHHSQARVWFHHFTFYGFLLCFASTSVAAFYHYVLDWRAPYGYLSLPVALGTLGGIGLLIGPAGLYVLKLRRDPATADVDQSGMDIGFMVLLFLTSLTGLLLLALRESPAMGTLLVVHLGVVMALFLTLPYGKFVHAIYRGAALLRNALERGNTP